MLSQGSVIAKLSRSLVWIQNRISVVSISSLLTYHRVKLEASHHPMGGGNPIQRRSPLVRDGNILISNARTKQCVMIGYLISRA
jgi:hypothetical protein